MFIFSIMTTCNFSIIAKFRITLLFLLALTGSYSVVRESFYINAETLNLRDTSGTEGNVKGKFNGYKAYLPEQYSDGWSKLSIRNTERYVYKKYLSSQPVAQKNAMADSTHLQPFQGICLPPAPMPGTKQLSTRSNSVTTTGPGNLVDVEICI